MMDMALRWDKLSPEEFQQLQDLAEYSSHPLQQVLEEFCASRGQSPDGDIDYEGFRRFLDTFLDVKTPDELSRHLFLSFVRRPSNAEPAGGLGGLEPEKLSTTTPHSSSFVGRLQGLTERLHLTHHRGDSSEATSKSRTGSVHPVLTVMQTSYSCQDVIDSKKTDSSPNHSQMSRNSSRKSNNSLLVNNGKYEDIKNFVRKSSTLDVHTVRISLKDIVCYLSLLEAGRPEDKLEFMFRLYDTDANGVLDTNEMDCIVNQMMAVAEYLGWDVSELRPILKEMMIEIDYDADGTVSLEEWKRGGLTTIPLLVLLGLDTSVAGDGEHAWRLKHFNRPAYCNLCLSRLVGLGKKGLCCIFCKYTVHERCVQRAPSNCIQTHAGVRSASGSQAGAGTGIRHHWVEGNCRGRCARCRAPVKGINGISGMRCRWCQILVHNRCCGGIKNECTLGPHSMHILPPISLCPRVLDRQRSLPPPTPSEVTCSMVSSYSMPLTSATTSALRPSPSTFQVCTVPQGSCPLLVFVNPKSGGRQGARIMRKFQYILNPRQVHDLSKGGPTQGLSMFKDVQNFRVICCGGDGTVGWVLETMDKIQLEIQPAVGVIPLGTGNDLARCLRWGGGYEGESLHKILDRIEKSSVVMLDRWQIDVINADTSEVPSTPSESCSGIAPSIAPYNIINNYFSIGVDAAICVKFHVEREKNPNKFSSRMKNKLWYFEYATTEQFAASCKNLQEHIDVVCDGVTIDLSKGSRLQGIALLNIPFAHGGSNLWGDPPPRRPRSRSRSRTNAGQEICLAQAVQDIGDKMIEVVGLENCLHMGQVRTGLRASGQRLAQCKSVTIVTRKTLPMQIDGEPWMQPPCQINITHKNQVPMLMSPPQERNKSFLRFFPRC